MRAYQKTYQIRKNRPQSGYPEGVPQHENITLSFQAGKGFKKSVGKATGRDGLPKPKMFWLGRDPLKAQIVAREILSRWQQLRELGATEWTADALQQIEELKGIIFGYGAISREEDYTRLGSRTGGEDLIIFKEASAAAILRDIDTTEKRFAKKQADAERAFKDAVAAEVLRLTGRELTHDQGSVEEKHVPASLTFHAAIDAYKAHFAADPLKSESWKAVAKHRLELLKDGLSDRPLAATGYVQLEQLVRYFAARPAVKRGRGSKGPAITEKRMSVNTVSHQVRMASRLFRWLYRTGKWNAPKGYEEAFRVAGRALLSEDERRSRGVVSTFTVDELAELWRAANGRARCLILLGLNCAFGAGEIKWLRNADIHLDSSPPHIHTQRHKNGVWGRWELWPETVAALKREVSGAEWAFVTRKGGRFGLAAVRYVWNGVWRDKGEVPRPAFGKIRKTASQMVRDVAGREVSETMLCHGDPTMGRFYNNPNFVALAEALRRVRQTLNPVFDTPND